VSRDQEDGVPTYDASDSSTLRFDALKNMMALLLADDAKEWLAAITSRVRQVMFYEWYLNELRVRKEEHPPPRESRADGCFRSGVHPKDIKKELNAQISKEQPRHLGSLLESFDTSDKRLLKVNRQLVVCRKVHDVKSKGGWIMIL